jgi:hypothetical protein
MPGALRNPVSRPIWHGSGTAGAVIGLRCSSSGRALLASSVLRGQADLDRRERSERGPEAGRQQVSDSSHLPIRRSVRLVRQMRRHPYPANGT